jgi:transcriptional regulator with XRE-family HTH domain
MQRRKKQIHPSDLRLRAIGAVVREFRERAGHSQERLSADCGFDRTYISRVERGIINPTVSRLWRIADVFEVSFTELAREMERWVKERERQARRSDSKRG